ncbi:MAG: hypothetical protein ACK5NG_01910 [Chthoniobacterales bacterium]
MKNFYQAGVASGDITPPVGGPLAGLYRGGHHSSTGIYHPLRVTATSITDEENTAVLIISSEWLGSYELTNRIREKISESTGIPASQIMLSATHTHCGPLVRKIGESVHGKIDQDYLEQAIETIVKTACRAMEQR